MLINKLTINNIFKCRQKKEDDPKKECPGTFKLNNDGSFSVKQHLCKRLLPIQCDIMIISSEIEDELSQRPTMSVKKLYDEKEVWLTTKYDSAEVAKYWPEYDSVDSAFFNYKNKLIPALPDSIDSLTDLPDRYKNTFDNRKFLISPLELFNKFIIMASLIGLTILSQSKKWYCDGTFKSAPKFYYQHYIIHGSYKSWPLPGLFSFLSGKSFELYDSFINCLKDRADEAGLVLNPEVISCDFEKGTIKAFKRHFPNAKIAGCHFHFSNAIHRKLCEIGR